ncbi:MAG: esterase-like activity of phytase family protein [Pseudomonadota bacterium]
MRRTLALTLILLLAVVPVLMVYPLPAEPRTEQPARLVTEMAWQFEQRWFGGLSGIDTTPDGKRYVAVTDRGTIFEGSITRDGTGIAEVKIDRWQQLPDKKGRFPGFPHTDAEGVALEEDGSVLVSFEVFHRILRYENWDYATWPSYFRSWRALERNKGMEALAVQTDGTILAIPEGVARGATVALVYRREPNKKWEQPFTLPLDETFEPVGADIGPDGKLYLLERSFLYGAFQSQVRRFSISAEGLGDAELVLRTNLGQHGNLEGMAVWQDRDGHVRLTMVSDNNFKPYLRMQLIEYVLDETLVDVAQ